MSGNIFIISGCSGSGKTAIIDYILKKRKNTTRAISFTTRSPRENEKESIDYFFITKARFLKKIETGDFIEFSEVYGQFYGTTADSFKKAKEGFDVIKVIDVQGAEKLRKLNIKAHFIFFEVPLEVLKKRLEGRKEAEIQERLGYYNEELSYKKYFDFIVDTSGTEKDIQKNARKVIKIMNSLGNSVWSRTKSSWHNGFYTITLK